MQYSNSVRPKKSFGQHFLTDLRIAENIADTLPTDAVNVIEVGPGTGVLTRFLLKKNINLKVVEIDRDSIAYLKNCFPELEGRIVEKDFLKLDLSELFSDPFMVIGNYPYNISSQIFFKVLENKEKIPLCSGMIQKEMAERIASPPGKKAYGIISVLLQAWYEIEYLFTVDEQVFDPPPKVKSAVVRLRRNSRESLGCDERLFKTIVKTTFNQRRKTLRNSLKSLLGKDCACFQLPLFDKRPEQLSVEEFIALTNLVADLSGSKT
ncbi:MAG: 16S rRNA (adenine(1518)-N(6)/adenine(1519)-N(6))-dimethyltransferase RsmA [Dysgonamonadaceae bacterium]|jgi:16S rRNA (adenine1518-N6/adenine1519-N6)-dimethyltransferase|nr:16S rRNA (adenine(1518)-N(6)/adenine(1519)-N(6))-dimethyltransferase RsmA [Dysgonamonadaceae bacterium]